MKSGHSKITAFGAMLWVLAGAGIGATFALYHHKACNDFMYADQWYCRIGVRVTSAEKPEWIK